MTRLTSQEPHRYRHEWSASLDHGHLVDRCHCGVLRNLDGSNDNAICSAAVREGRSDGEQGDKEMTIKGESNV